MENQLTRLREFITAHYDLDELRTLCFDLGINYDELRGQTLSGKASALILHVGREGELEQLLAALQGGRPDDMPALDVAALYDGLPAFEEGVFPPSRWDRFRRRRLLFYSSFACSGTDSRLTRNLDHQGKTNRPRQPESFYRQKS